MKNLLIMTFLLLSFTLFAKEPTWFKDPSQFILGCGKELLCMTGDADTKAEAYSEARVQFSKFISTKIKSKTQISNSSEQSGSTPINASFDEWTNKTLSEESSAELSGLEIKKEEEFEGRYYVVMSLDKNVAAKQMKEKIERLDAENSDLLALATRFAYPKIFLNLKMIQSYNQRYLLFEHSFVKLKNGEEIVRASLNKYPVLKINFSSKALPLKYTHFITSILSPLKIVFVGKNKASQFILEGEALSEEQYLKVDGFKKINVIFKLKLLQNKDVLVGKISSSSEQIARTTLQAIEKSESEIKNQIVENLSQLSTNYKGERL